MCIRDRLQPVPAAVQRQSFELISRAVLGPAALSVSPALQRRLAPDFLERSEFGLPTDFLLPQRLLDLQRAVVGYLLSDMLATRVLDSLDKLDPGSDRFGLAELQQRLARDVWSELGSARALSETRRELQRDYVNRVAAALLRPGPGARADARGLMRRQAEVLLARIEHSLKRRSVDEASRSHLRDSADSLRQALNAKLPRFGI